MSRGWAAVAVALALAVPASAHVASPRPPQPYENGQANSWGRIAMEPYVDARRGPVPVAATVRIEDSAALEGQGLVLFAFNLHTPTAHVRLVALETANGTPVPVSRDERDADPMQPRLLVEPANLTAGGPVDLVLRGEAWANGTGQFHVGALVISFTPGWQTLRTSAGEPAELYAFSLLSADRPTAGSAPFEGRGNPGWALPVALAALASGVAAAAWGLRRGR